MEALRERFGKYHVLDKIAQGGMAEVYKVKTVGIAGFEKVQALKRILPHSAREGRFIRSFIDEARIAVELTHRNIVQVFDFGKADGELFMAMELIEGLDLRSATTQATARSIPCPVSVAAYIVAEVAAGLDYAHRRTDGYGGPLGIVHCDVSPSNVMLSTDGYVKILDFGIARATFASALERRRLRGKPRYMAPEQTLGEPPSAAADVFALGIIAWELLTGAALFRGTTVKQVLESVRTTVPPRVETFNPGVPLEICDAVATALQREPSARGTAADLGAALTRTAMAAGAGELSNWLREIAGVGSDEALPARPSRELTTREPALPLPAIPSPPLRPSTRSMTGSVSRYERLSSTGIGNVQFGDRDPTGSITSHKPFAGFEASQTTPATHPRWVASDLPPEAPPDDDVVAPPRRPYEVLVSSAGNAASMRFDDDDATQFVIAAPLGEATAVQVSALAEESLQVEADDDMPIVADEAALREEPIDDELVARDTGALSERRRSVIATGLLEGGAAEVLRPIARAIGELAYQRGGVVLRVEDDSLVVAFGLEVAGEDDVAVAMGWALDASALARDAGLLDHEGRGPVLKVGARTGVAVSAAPDVAVEGRMSFLDGALRLPSDAVDDARALARDAAPDRPLFVGAAGRMTSGLYTLREVAAPKRIRRGKVFEVVGPRGIGERDRASLERRGTFVGRTQQLADLETWLQRAVAADRRLTALITGAAGTGKSRLVAELFARCAMSGSPMRTIVCAASPSSHNAPFALVIDFYQAALNLPPARGRAARAQVVSRLLHALEEHGVPDDRARAVATDLDRAMELRDGSGVLGGEVADLRPRISAGVATFRAAMSDRTRPLLTVIEDIHLADSASLDVIRHALGVTVLGPELLIMTARPEGPPPPAVDVVIQVGDLAGAELRALIADRLGDAATPLNIAAVIARGGGNPLFVEELAAAVRESGDAVPATARDVIAARADRLSARAKLGLRFASVLGGTIRRALLEELMASEDPEEGLATNAAAIDEIVDAGILVRPDGAREDELQFARGLIREVIYESLSARAQRDSHARIGRLLASRFFASREEPPAVIAEHMERGGETAAAAAFWLRAGRLALAAFDATAAVAHFSRTVLLERELGATPPTTTSRTRRREAFAGREEAHRMAGDLVSDASDVEDLARLADGEPRRLADVALRRAHRLLRLGDYGAASVSTVVAEDHALSLADARLRGEALAVRGEILERLGRFDEALMVIGDAIELFEREAATADETAAMIVRGRIHLMRAQYEAARDAYRPVLARIEATGDEYLERIVQSHVAISELCLGHYAAAMTSAERSVELCRRYGDRAREGEALSVRGIILLEVGLYDAAARTFAEALELLGRTGSRWSRADCLIYAGACEMRRGSANGLAMVDEALGEARRLGARYLEASALVARAGIQLRRGDFDAAIAAASDGTIVARDATLVGYEIQGLARHALALARLPAPRLAEASALVARALALLDAQRYLEGSEEEVYLYCSTVLRDAGAHERAAVVGAWGKREVERKLAALADPVWRSAYASVPECAALLAGSRGGA